MNLYHVTEYRTCARDPIYFYGSLMPSILMSQKCVIVSTESSVPKTAFKDICKKANKTRIGKLWYALVKPHQASFVGFSGKHPS